jgi:AAHS family 4-hydroxybenzoate transporter-like MFS transporter
MDERLSRSPHSVASLSALRTGAIPIVGLCQTSVSQLHQIRGEMYPHERHFDLQAGPVNRLEPYPASGLLTLTMACREWLARRPRFLVSFCFLLLLIDGYDTVQPSFVAPLVASEFMLKLASLGQLFTFGYLGGVIGAIVAGGLADRFGRRLVLAGALAVTASALIACLLAATFNQLLALRLVAGLGLGGALPSLVALSAEASRTDDRSSAVTIAYIGYPIGAVAGGLVTALAIDAGWRSIFAAGGVMALIALPLSFLFPETLRVPCFRGGRKGFGASTSIGGQFAEGRAAAVFLLWTGLFSTLLMTYLLISWIPTIAAQSGLPPRIAALTGMLLNLGGVIGALAMIPVVRRYGPFFPVAIVIAVAAVSIYLLGHSFRSVSLFATAVFFVGFTGIGSQLNCPAMTVQLFPPSVRATGTGWVTAAGRLGSIAGPALGGVLIGRNLPVDRLFLIVAAPAALAAISFGAAGLLRPKFESALQEPSRGT